MLLTGSESFYKNISVHTKSKIGCYSPFFEYTFPSFKRDKKMHYLPLPKSKQDIRQLPEKVKNYPYPLFRGGGWVQIRFRASLSIVFEGRTSVFPLSYNFLSCLWRRRLKKPVKIRYSTNGTTDLRTWTLRHPWVHLLAVSERPKRKLSAPPLPNNTWFSFPVTSLGGGRGWNSCLSTLCPFLFFRRAPPGIR